jgi:drug/metabolite transporter (DMT)-like permease
MTISLAAFFGTACDIMMRLALAEGYPRTEAIFLRGISTLLWLAVPITALGMWRTTVVAAQPLVMARSIFDSLQLGFFIAALSLIPLAVVTAGIATTPIWITLLSVILLREKVGWRRWLAIAVGFLGMVLIIKPNSSAFQYATLFAIGSGLMAASRDIFTRRIDACIGAWVLTFISTVVVVIASFLMGLLEAWRPVEMHGSMLLMAAGIFQIICMYLMITGLRQGEISITAPFRYTALIWALIGGYVVFGELIDALSLAGAVLIVAAGICTLWRETFLKIRRERVDTRL